MEFSSAPDGSSLYSEREAEPQQGNLAVPRRLVSLPFIDLLLEQQRDEARQGNAPINRHVPDLSQKLGRQGQCNDSLLHSR